jgi:VCBS repeat protein
MSVRRLAAIVAPAGLVSVLLAGAAGAADPSYTPSAVLPTGDNPASFAAADVNGDGKRDFAVANLDSDNITILLGNGSGGFGAAPGSPVAAGDGPVGVEAADLNGDGKADLAVANGRSENLTVLLGDGTGGFGAAPGSPFPVGGSPGDIAAADLNGDGDVDLALPVWQNNWRIAILLGDGAGGFAPAPGSPVALGVRFGTTEIALADLNGDAKRDLLIANGDSRTLSIRFGDGLGGFGAARAVAAGNAPSSLAVADLNADGRPDLAVGTGASATGGHAPRLAILLGNGAGSFRHAAGSPKAVPGTPSSVEVADVNADRRLDVAVANLDADSVSVLIGNGAGRFRPATDSPFPAPPPTELSAADLNADGKVDFAVASPQGFLILYRTSTTPAIARGRALSGRPPNAQFSTRGLITKVAADGNRVAVKTTVKSSRSCGRILVWTAPGRRSRSFSTSNPGCGSILCERGSGCVDELALGDGQVAWISRSGGNTLELMINAARLSGGPTRRIEHVFNGAGAGGDQKGQWVGQLLGGGSLLAYHAWSVVCDSPDEVACDEGRATLRSTNERIVRISAGRRSVVKRGEDSRRLRAVGGGRMALETEGAITILGRSGARVATIPASPGDPTRAIGLSGTRLAVTRTFALDLYNAANGAKVKSIPLGPAAALALTGVNSRLALLRGPRRWVLVRLSDGRLIELPLPAGRASTIVDARLTTAGLFYAYNTARGSARGRIVFEPTARLLARF